MLLPNTGEVFWSACLATAFDQNAVLIRRVLPDKRFCIRTAYAAFGDRLAVFIHYRVADCTAGLACSFKAIVQATGCPVTFNTVSHGAVGERGLSRRSAGCEDR